jgi:hypothetical protein
MRRLGAEERLQKISHFIQGASATAMSRIGQVLAEDPEIAFWSLLDSIETQLSTHTLGAEILRLRFDCRVALRYALVRPEL